MLADVVDAVVGIDTHRDTHHAEIALPTGAPIATISISNTHAGFALLLAWIHTHLPGPRLVAAIEGTRSYGLRLTHALTTAGVFVIEAEQPDRTTRRGRGKSDPIDAHLAVLTALRTPIDRLPIPRADGDREALRTLLVARDDLTTVLIARTNALRDLLRTSTSTSTSTSGSDSGSDRTSGSDRDAELARARLTTTVLAELTRRRLPRTATRAHAVRHAEIRRLAISVRETTRELKTNKTQLQAIVNDLAPGLTDRPGIGPITAAHAIIAFSHPGRCRNDAAFAALAGTSPLQASSGRTVRHRLNRGGDRALNRAIHTIALTRMRDCTRTRAYVERRRAEAKTDREIRRCLKRYITRELYRVLTTTMTTPATTINFEVAPTA